MTEKPPEQSHSAAVYRSALSALIAVAEPELIEAALYGIQWCADWTDPETGAPAPDRDELLEVAAVIRADVERTRETEVAAHESKR